jgi:hypothetical protein
MKLKPRFVFHANASAMGGRIGKPKDILIESGAASSLSAAGGRSTSRTAKGTVGDVIRFGSASTFAEGQFDDLAKWIETLCGDLSADTLTTTTKVNAEVRDVAVDAKAPFTAKRIRGGLISKSPRAGGEPAIALDDDTVIEGAAIGGFKLVVQINTRLFQQYDTLAKLRTAADDPKFVKQNGAHLFMTADVPGRTTASPAGRFVESTGVIYGTIVKSIDWADKPYPGAVIDGNVITIPGCGDIYFGEILISARRRRLMMLRLEFCCPQPGGRDSRAAAGFADAPVMMMMSDTEDNGSWGI